MSMTFAEWFEAQHGPRPSPIEVARLWDSIQSQESALARDKDLVARLEEWESKRTAALYAWQIRDAQKESNR